MLPCPCVCRAWEFSGFFLISRVFLGVENPEIITNYAEVSIDKKSCKNCTMILSFMISLRSSLSCLVCWDIFVCCRDQVMLMETSSKQEIVDALAAAPGGLEAEDIEDFCSLAQYYSSRTPQSFRRVRKYTSVPHSLTWSHPWAFELKSLALTHCGLVISYDDRNLGQHWLR